MIDQETNMYWLTLHRIACVTLAFILGLTARTHAAEKVVDRTRGFTLTLPDGFVPHPALTAASPDFAHGFVLGDPNDDEFDIAIVIEDMGGTIGRERLTSLDIPPGFTGSLFTAHWRGFEVDGIRIPEVIEGVEMVTFNVQIPLRQSAIQLKLIGPLDRESELNTLLTAILNGLTGESNWIGSALPITSMSSREYGTLLLVMGIVLFLGGLITLWLISRKTPPGTVLTISAMILVVSFSIGDVRIREVMMFTGALRMLGWAGLILGLFDLKRKKPTPQTAEESPNNGPDP